MKTPEQTELDNIRAALAAAEREVAKLQMQVERSSSEIRCHAEQRDALQQRCARLETALKLIESFEETAVAVGTARVARIAREARTSERPGLPQVVESPGE